MEDGTHQTVWVLSFSVALQYISGQSKNKLKHIVELRPGRDKGLALRT